MSLLDDLREEIAEQEADSECDSAWTAELLRRAAAEIERLQVIRAKLQRVRDWLKSAANSEGDMVDEIDNVLEAAETTGDES